MRPSQIALAALVALAAAQALYYYPQLPDSVASHFSGGGVADGWSSRGAFLGGMMAVNGLVAVVFLFFPPLIGRIPVSMISLPRREYWLAPERRDTTIRRLGDQLAWFGCATVVLMIFVVQATIHANLNPPPVLPGWTAWLIGGYVACSVGWAVWLTVSFGRIPTE